MKLDYPVNSSRLSEKKRAPRSFLALSIAVLLSGGKAWAAVQGTLVARGLNTYGQSAVPTNLSGVVAITAGYYHSLALKGDGTVVAWGYNEFGQSTVPTNLSGVVAIGANYTPSFALKQDGIVVGWGNNASGQRMVPTNLRQGSLSTTFTNGMLLFTLDGSEPDFSSRIYSGPFVMRQSATLRTVAYNADFTQAVPSDPLEIVILPTLSAATAGGGSVAVDPPAGAWSGNGTAVVTATPAPGWTFLQWLGDATGTNPVASVSMSRNKCVQAVFGTGLGYTVVGSGSVARSSAAALYPHGTEVRLTAVPAAGNYFALWGNAANGTNNPFTFTVTNANAVVTAVFAALPANQHALTVLSEGFGSVSASPRANRYGAGTGVTLTATPDAGQSFVSWSGDASGTQNPLTVVMNSSKVITANFTKRPTLAPVLCGGAANGEEMQLLLTGEFGAGYVIEATTSFALPPASTTWTPLATVTNSFGAVQFNDPFVTNRTQRFYRAVGP